MTLSSMKSTILIVVLWTIQYLIPEAWTDPWHLIPLKKIVFLVFALSCIQYFGEIASHLFGSRNGAVVKGFLGGLISSTAITVSLARRSRSDLPAKELKGSLTLPFLAATAAMLLECMLLIQIGNTDVNPKIFVLFAGPVLMTIVLIFLEARRHKNHEPNRDLDLNIDIESVLKLTVFIIGVIVLSKVFIRAFGPQSLSILTFSLSLFEMHSSVIANTQLFGTKVIDFETFGQLMALSLLASYLAKMGLVAFGGSKAFRKKILIRGGLLLLSVVLSWFAFIEMGQLVPSHDKSSFISPQKPTDEV